LTKRETILEQAVELADYERFHTEFQIEHFIIAGAGVSPYGEWKQIRRELAGRLAGLRGFRDSKIENALETERLEKSWRWTRRGRTRRFVMLRKLEESRADMIAAERDTVREIRAFRTRLAELVDRLGDLTPERRAELESDFWFRKLRASVALEVLSSGRVAKNTLDAVVSCPPEWWPHFVAVFQDPSSVLPELTGSEIPLFAPGSGRGGGNEALPAPVTVSRPPKGSSVQRPAPVSVVDSDAFLRP